MESEQQTSKIINLREQIDYMLQNAVLMTEMGIDLKEKGNKAEKYVCCLRSLAVRAGKTINALQNSSRSFLLLAQKLVSSALQNIESIPVIDGCNNLKIEYEKLLNIIERELGDNDDTESLDSSITNTPVNMSYICDKIKYLETRQKSKENSLLPPSSSTKSVNKSEIDEKYPENLSRESLIDLDNVINLPTVPEDSFSGFSSKPTRSSSLSSLKSMRKVKLFLQRACSVSDDDDESSEPDDHEVQKPPGDGEEVKTTNSPYTSIKKVLLGNITEETQLD